MTGVDDWTSPEFHAEARAWIAEHAGITGEIEQPHLRYWSTVLRVPTDDGTLWFKAVSKPVHTFEVPLTRLLADERPDDVPQVVAVDEARAWMLLRDGGTRLREAGHSVEHLERILPQVAEVQLAVAPRAGELLALGVPDERLASLPDHFAELLRQPELMMLDQAEGLTVQEYDRARSLRPELERMCRELAGYGIPETIQHDDLHDGNVFVDDGRYRIFDWGDACVSHPFHTLTVALRAAAWKLELEPGGAEIRRLRDAYLEPFSSYASRDELRAAADLAYRTGTLARALAWQRYIDGAPAGHRDDDLSALPYGIRKFLERGPLGAWADVAA